jgi:hypothetical protein
MAFPQIVAVAKQGSNGASTTNYPLVWPAGGGQGDLLLAILVPNTTLTGETPQGWTLLGETTEAPPAHVFVRVAENASSGSVTIEGNSSRYASIGYRISGWTGEVSNVYVSAFINSATVAADPPNLDPGQGAQDFLWFAGTAARTTSWTYTTPSGYGGCEEQISEEGDNTYNRKMVLCRRELNAASENPASFNPANGHSNYRSNSFTIAVLGGDTGLAFTVAPTVTSRTTDSYTIGGTLSEQGDVFAVAILPESTDPTTPAQIIAGTDGGDVAARGTGQQLGVTNFSFNITGDDLSDNPTHDIFVVGRKQT